MVNSQKQINDAISRIKELESVAKGLYKKNKATYDANKSLAKSFADFFAMISSTKKKLSNPTFSIAMVGTTSAGKSTIINALSSRSIAPMEQKEMSAGVLRLLHSEKYHMEIARTENCRWETGKFPCTDDDTTRETIRRVYEKYRKFIDISASPEITVYCPLRWQTNKDILGLPDGVNVEFLDLPGVKTLTDDKNLRVVQEKLAKAMCVIAIDFTDVDDTRIQRLLDELKDVVKAMSNKTDSLMFIVNKVNLATQTDIPVNTAIFGGDYNGTQIKGLKEKIVEGLNLSQDTDIRLIPFNGLLLYWIEQSILRNAEGTIVDYNKESLKKLFVDCSNEFKKDENKALLTREEIKLCRNIDNAIEDEEDIEIEDITKFVEVCYKLSHAEELYVELNKRIQNSFYQVVIRPILTDFLAMTDKMIAELHTHNEINKKNSKLDLVSEQIGILKMRVFLLGSSDDTLFDLRSKECEDILATVEEFHFDEDTDEFFVCNRIVKDLHKIQNEIESRKEGFIKARINDVSESVSEISRQLETIKGAEKVNKYLNDIKESNRAVHVFNGISSIPEEIKKRLVVEIITPFRMSLDTNKTRGEYIELASKTIPTSCAHDLGGQYGNINELFRTTFSSFTRTDMYYEEKATSEYSDQWMHNVLSTYTRADVRMRDILSKMSNKYIQLDAIKFQDALRTFLETEMKTILDELKKKLQTNETDLGKLVENIMKVNPIGISLPDSIFEFSRPSHPDPEPGSTPRRVIDYWESHSCSSDEAHYKTVYDKYFLYRFENSKSVYNRWENGISNSFSPFWAIITKWINENVTTFLDNIGTSAIEVAEMTTSFLEDKLKDFNAANEANMASYNKVDVDIEKMVNLKGNF